MSQAPDSEIFQVAAVPAIRIVLSDRHTMVREGLRRLLEDEADLHVVAEAADGNEAMALVRRLAPDVLVLGSDAGHGNAGSVLERLTATGMPIPVVILGGNGAESLENLVQVGARGFLPKTAPSRELITAIREVSSGGSYLRSYEPVPSTSDEVLRGEEPTRRELDVLRLLAEGCSNREIGERLGIGEPTVRYHIGHIFMKLRARSRTQAVYLARQRGWIP